MSFPWTTAQIDAIARLALSNGGIYNATTNPTGLAQGGHRVNFAPDLNRVATVAGAVKDAADYAGAAAQAAADAADEAAGQVGKLSGTSATSLALGTGTKAFVTQAGKSFEPGRTLRVVSAADPTGHYMVGRVTSYSGTALTLGVLVAIGTGTRADWLIYVEGEIGPRGTLEIGEVTALAPGAAPTVQNAGTAEQAVLAIGLPRGMPAGLIYRWSTGNTATDPGAGKLKVSSASLTSANALYISETDQFAVAQSAVLASWDDSTNAVRGQLRVEDVANPANFVVYAVAGVLTDQGPWNTISVAYVDKGGTLADGALVRVEFMRAGDQGAHGLDGEAATVAVGDVTTVAAGAAAKVTNRGDQHAAVLDFELPRGSTGPIGPVVAVRYRFAGEIADADPGDGGLRFNSATISAVTRLFVDNLEALAGTAMAAWLDSFDDSTNPSNRGTLAVMDVADPSKLVLFRVTGPVVDGTGYRKVPVAWVAGAGAFAANAALAVAFWSTGDKGTDGAGAGDVVGPATATDGGVAIFNGATGKLLQSGGVLGSLAFRNSVNGADWSGADLGVADGGTGASTPSAARTNLGVAIGSDVQAYHPNLGALSLLVGAADRVPVFTGAGAMTLLTLGTGAGAVPRLDSGGKLDTSILPALAITDTFVVGSQAAMLALTAEVGDVAIRTDLNKSFVLRVAGAGTLANWSELLTPTDAVLSVAGLTGAITSSALLVALSLDGAVKFNASQLLNLSQQTQAKTNQGIFPQGTVTRNGNQSLPASDFGKVIYLPGYDYTLTLPDITTVNESVPALVVNGGGLSKVTFALNGAGGGAFVSPEAPNGFTTLNVPFGTHLWIMKSGTNWLVTYGSDAGTINANRDIAFSTIQQNRMRGQLLAAEAGNSGDPNALLNSAFDQWQRIADPDGTGLGIVSGATAFAADRWGLAPTGGVIGVYRSTTVPPTNKSRYSMLIFGSTGLQYIDILYSIEARDIPKIKGAGYLDFWMYNGGSGVNNTQLYVAGRTSLNGPVGTYTNVGYTPDAPVGTWGRIAIPVDVTTISNYQNGLQLLIRVGLNTLGSSSNFLYIAEAQLRLGSALVPFERRDPTVDLLRCMRYYETGPFAILSNAYAASAYVSDTVRFRVPKRTQPSVSTSTSYSTGAGSVVVNQTSVDHARVHALASAAAAIIEISGTYTASAEL